MGTPKPCGSVTASTRRKDAELRQPLRMNSRHFYRIHAVGYGWCMSHPARSTKGNRPSSNPVHPQVVNGLQAYNEFLAVVFR